MSELAMRRGLVNYGVPSFSVYITADTKQDALAIVEGIKSRPQVQSCKAESDWYDGAIYKCRVYRYRVELRDRMQPAGYASLMRWIESQLV